MKIDMPGQNLDVYIPGTSHNYGGTGSTVSGSLGDHLSPDAELSPNIPINPNNSGYDYSQSNNPILKENNTGYSNSQSNSQTTNVYNYDPNLTSGYQSFLDAMANYFTGNSDWERTQLQNKFNADEAQKNREFNALEAQKNRDYQTAMSNTAYQRAFADMRSAGLNPYLVYNQGGAMTPSGATASGTSAYATSYKADKDGFNALASIMSALVKNSTSANYLATSVMKLFGK